MDRATLSVLYQQAATWTRRALYIVAICFAAVRQQAMGQDASLLLVPPAGPQQKGGLSMENCSFRYRRLPPESEQRELQLNDIVTVLVDYRSTLLSEGDAKSKRNLSFNAVLSDWLKFDGKNLTPASFNNGDPRIKG